MAMQPGVRDLLRERMNRRTLAAILGYKDREVNRFLPDDVADELRYVVLSECNAFLELVFDVVDTVDDGSCVVNEVWLDELAAMVVAKVDEHARVGPTPVGAGRRNGRG